MVEGVRFNAGKTRPRRSNVFCFNGKGEKLGLDKPVVAAFKLCLQHFGVFGSDTVKVVILWGNRDTALESSLFAWRLIKESCTLIEASKELYISQRASKMAVLSSGCAS